MPCQPHILARILVNLCSDEPARAPACRGVGCRFVVRRRQARPQVRRRGARRPRAGPEVAEEEKGSGGAHLSAFRHARPTLRGEAAAALRASLAATAACSFARREAAAEPTKFVCRDALSPLGEAASNHSLSDAAESAGAAITFSGVRVLVAPSAVPLGRVCVYTSTTPSGPPAVGRSVCFGLRAFVSDNDRCPFPETALGFVRAVAVFTTPRWILIGCRGLRAARTLLLLF